MTFFNQCIRLSSGYEMPLVGIGTYRIYDQDTINDAIDESLKVGFRLIDTAAVYRNEEKIGYALNKYLPIYNLKREDIFITTKLSPSDNGNPTNIVQAVHNSLKNLGTSYIDLYLIHWPGAAKIPENSKQNIELRYNTWKVLIDLQKQNLIRSIGVSNYTIEHLKHLFNNSPEIIPAVNQVECHPYYRQQDLINYCKAHNIHIQAYSSLGTSDNKELLENPIVKSISSELNVSSARLLLKWALQQEISVIPKATKREHIRDNIRMNFNINEEQMKKLCNLSQKKFAWDPSNVY